MSELRQFKLPDVGEGLTEADIVKWHVQPGDKVTINQVIVEIETAKAVVELPCPYEGVVAALLVPEGTTADVGTAIISVEVGAQASVPQAGPQPLAPRGSTSADLVPPPPAEAGESGSGPGEGQPEPGEGGQDTAGPRLHGSPARGQAAEEDQERQSVLVGYGVKPGSTTRRPRKPAAPAAPADLGRTDLLAKPPVRKLAKDLGIDLTRLSGTGPSGSITRDDVQSAARGEVPASGLRATEPVPPARDTVLAQVAPVAAVAREERIPIRGVRKHTADAMVGSAFSAPHVTEFLQIDISETMAATARLRTLPEFRDVRVSPLLLVARALIVAIARHPVINSSWDEKAQEIVVKHYVNLGIAAATERGLIVPNIRDAHSLSFAGLARALAELAGTARAGRCTPADLRGGTITITNVGIFGVDAGTPILSPGEAAILAFGRVKDAPWVHQGQLAVRKVTTLGLSFDHRIVDGDLGSAVLRDVGAMLEDPLRMLAWT